MAAVASVLVLGGATATYSCACSTPTFGGGIDGPCFAAPGSCGFPDPNYGNVGVPSGTSLTSSGSITVNTDGATVDAKDVTGTITVNANNVTIQNSRVTANSSEQLFLVVMNNPGNLTINDVEFTGAAPNSVQHAVRNDSGGSITMNRVYQHGTVDSLCYCGQDNAGANVVTINDSYSYITLSIPDDHLENIYTDDSTIIVDHSTMFNDQPQTSVIFGNTNNGFDGAACSSHYTVTDSLMAGGGYILGFCGHQTLGYGDSTAVITGNRFARCGHGVEVDGGSGTWVCPGVDFGDNDGMGFYPRGGSFFTADPRTGDTTWSNNVWDDDDSEIPEP